MVYAFTEEEKAKIEKFGMKVVEFKRCLKKISADILEAWKKLEELFEATKYVCKMFLNKLSEIVDNCKFKPYDFTGLRLTP